MEKEVIEKLDELIKDGKIFSRENITYLQEGEFRSAYITWKYSALRFIKAYSPDDYTKFFNFANNDSNLGLTYMLGILKAIKNIPIIQKTNNQKKEKNPNIVINNTNSQSQIQSQELINSIFIESIKDELTGKQQKEIKAILEAYKDKPEEVKPKIIDKLKSFGSDVASNILANILTNPSVWNVF